MLTIDQTNVVLERAYANGDKPLAAAAERVVQALSGVKGVVLVGDVAMVETAQTAQQREQKAGLIRRFFFNEEARYFAQGRDREAARTRVASELLDKETAVRLYDLVAAALDGRTLK